MGERELLVQVLVSHQRTDITGCRCGWAVLGASHADHVASVFFLARGFLAR